MAGGRRRAACGRRECERVIAENQWLEAGKALGIPVSLFTGIFAMARTVGWIAQLNEMIADPEYKIGRPRQLYSGAAPRTVKPLGER